MLSVKSKKAIITYCPFKPDQLIPSVDRITSRGSSGLIALEEVVDSSNRIYDAKDNDTSIQRIFVCLRFNNMSLAILSNSTCSTNLSVLLNCIYKPIPHTLHTLVACIDQLSAVDVVFIDFTGIADAWNTVNDLASYYQQDDSIIQCIISPLSHRKETIVKFRPIQSYMMKRGECLSISKTCPMPSLIYSYLHIGVCRTDKATMYSTVDIEQNGGNNIILAWHLLAEIGYKLGFIPKYGA
ncbi:MAG: hypothetical protein EXX96DRAFT_614655 [Benjaminiella poitrasii]|nr:MAG: hypothetical protein EXX96DRAFT_614655 [Benjaminiella poitrasii]